MNRFKSHLLLLLWNVLLLLLLLAAVEWSLRKMDLGVYSAKKEKPKLHIQPQGPYYEVDSLLGYRHLPGQYQLQLAPQFTFTTTHNAQAHRICPNTSYVANASQSTIWLMGCSFTHGWAVSDEETFACLLQEQCPNFHLVNWGTNGYGTLHIYLQLQQALATVETKPQLVVLNHADFHFGRNIWSHHMRRLLSRWNHLGAFQQPYVDIHAPEELTIRYAKDFYQAWDWSYHSALIHQIQIRYEYYLDHSRKERAKHITYLILEEIKALCESHDIPLLFTNMAYEPDFIQGFCQDNNLPFLDISIDTEQAQFNNEPYDGHPNALAHQLYATRLAHYFKHYLSNWCPSDWVVLKGK